MRVKHLKEALDQYNDEMIVEMEDTNEYMGELYDIVVDDRMVDDEDGDRVNGVVIRRA